MYIAILYLFLNIILWFGIDFKKLIPIYWFSFTSILYCSQYKNSMKN